MTPGGSRTGPTSFPHGFVMAEPDLQHRLEGLGRRLLDDVEHWEQRTREDRAKAIDSITAKVGEQVGAAIAAAQKSRDQKREARLEAREKKRHDKRQRELEEASVPGGIVQLVLAAVCIAFAILRPDLWWLIFVALGVGASGGRKLSLASERRHQLRASTAEPERAPTPAQAHEVDVACDQLLADLKASPEAVRSFLQQPEKTVESLRATCKALDARRLQLAQEDAKGRLLELSAQRSALAARRDATVDTQARKKLDDAVRSLDGQATALGQLAAVTERVEGEYTSLLVLLQELKTRVAVAKSTGSEVQLTGLRENVTRLNAELGAISEAMEAVQRQDLSPVVDVGGGEAAATGGTRERA